MEALRRTRTLWTALVVAIGGYITVALVVAGYSGLAVCAVLCILGLTLPWFAESTKLMRRIVYFWMFGVVLTLTLISPQHMKQAVMLTFGGAGLIVAAVAWIFKRL